MRSALSVLTIILVFAGTAHAQVNRAGGMLGDYSKKSKSQGRHSTFLQRLTIGYGQHFVYNTLDVQYRTNDVTDTSFKATLKSTAPMVGFLNFNIPLATISRKSAFTLDIGFSYTAFTLKYDSVLVNRDSIALTEEFPVSIMSLPISFDFKTGGEATLSKENRLLFTAGVGVAPSYVMADINPEAKIKAMPFVKIEAGFFAGLAFKLRALAYIGNARYIDDEGAQSKVPGITSRVSGGGFGYTISLGVMPFSYKWKPAF